MWKSKSFSLNHELDAKARKRERLYDPRRICWMKYLVILLLIGFALLLVLSNVDFSGESSEFTVATARHKEISNDTTEDAQLAVQYTTASTARASLPASFTCKDNRSCKTVVCTGGPIHSLTDEFEDEILKWCDGYFDVIIENCTFFGKAIGVRTMNGRYKLNSLTIRNCVLETIADNAFNYSTVQNLVNLTFEGVQLQSLNAKSFEGLKGVTNFKLLNVEQNASTSLTAQDFLQPMASGLSTLVLQQSQESSPFLTIYDPTNWLGGSELFVSLVSVDLSGTNFNHTLNRNTFGNLLTVKQLWLVNCGLHTIAESTFGGILKTLETLDLRDNQLQMLDGELLAAAATTGVRINLSGNPWSCECDNSPIIEYVKQKQQNYDTEQPECASPKEYKGVQVRYVQLRCDETTSLPILNSTMSTTLPAITTTTLSATTVDAITTTSPISTRNTNSTSHITISTETIPLTAIPTTTFIPAKSDETEETDTTWTSIATTSKTIATQQTTSVSSTSSPTSTTEIGQQTSNGTLSQTLPTSTSQIWTSSPTNYTECYSYSSLKLLSCDKSQILLNSSFVLTVPTPLCNYDAIFNVFTISSTGVQVLIEQSASGLQILYFQALTYNYNFTSMIKSFSSLDVNGLKPNQSYVFCVIPVGGLTTSPFNCRSAYLPLEKVEPWLRNSDRVLFYTITIFMTVMLGVVGVAAIYWLLRCRPTLIRGNKRIQRIASTSYEVILLPKTDNTPLDSQEFALSELRSSMNDTITSDNCKSNDYMQYFKSIELSKLPKVTNISDNRPPSKRAPTLPPIAEGRSQGDIHHSQCIGIKRKSSNQFSVLMEEKSEKSPRCRMRQQCTTVEESENEYESLDYYQELF